MLHLTRIVVLFLACLAGACSKHYEVAEQDFMLRFAPEADTLLVFEVERGITASTDKTTEALIALERALQGGKCFPPEQGFLAIDLDHEEDEDWSPEDRAAYRECAANVKVEEARVFRDAGKALGFARLTRLTNLQRTLDLVNAGLNASLKDDASDDDPDHFEPGFPIYDEVTRGAMKRAVVAGHAWLSVRDGALVLDLPMSEANAARCVAAIARKEADEFACNILSQISSLSIADGHALIRFCEPNQPVVRFSAKRGESEIDEGLLSALRARKVLVFEAEALERMQKQFDAPTKAVPGGK